MNKQVFILLVLICIAHTIFGQNIYNVGSIADSLTNHADAVIRFYNTSYKNGAKGKCITDEHYAITVLNPNGKHSAELVIYYDQNTHITDIKGYLYNKNGVLQHKLKKKDIRDYAANGDYTLFSDNRVKHFIPAVTAYPFTIEYKYTVENTGTAGFDTWMPQRWFNIAIESAKLSFCTNDESDFKYLELNHDFIKHISDTNNTKSFTWEVKNLKAVEFEPHAPNYLDFMPAVLLSPGKVLFEKTEGDFSTWHGYGKWVYSLINGRDELSEETAGYIKSLTDTIHIKKDKIKAIYKYMQSKTRYVSIALGIGGFQPMPAMDVDSKGYGDCKALSNYTKALLQCIGITSYYTEIGAGEYQEIKFTDFASANQTDHIILCVPMDSDTIWLECTNQNIPFGFLPPGCQNRYALLIKPTGGELVKTPSFSAKENSRISSIDLDVKKCGEIDFAISTEYNNNLYGQVFPLIHASQKEQKEYLLKHLSSSNNVDIEKIQISDNSGDTAKATIYTEGKLINFTSLAGSMILLAPEFFHQNDFLDFIPANRTLDIFEPFGFSYSDTLRISFPADYSLDYLQNGKQFSSVFGQCEFDVEHKENTITLIRKLSINQGQYSRSAFKEINEFLRNISDYQNKKIVLSKK